MMPYTSDTRVVSYEPLLAPAALLDELPLDDGLAKLVGQARADVCSVLGLMVDASHDNSGKDRHQQPAVARALADQVAAGNSSITGVMLESFLHLPAPRAAAPH